MLKKIFLAVFMLTLFISQNVSAQDVWVYSETAGTYNQYYVITETIANRSQLGRVEISATIKTVRGNRAVNSSKYVMCMSEGASWFLLNGNRIDTPIHESRLVSNLWDYCINYLGIRIDDYLRMGGG